jgi:hypothetical protein
MCVCSSAVKYREQKDRFSEEINVRALKENKMKVKKKQIKNLKNEKKKIK